MGGDDIDFNINFIKLVEQHSELYDHKIEGNSSTNKGIQERAWRAVANELGENWLTCKEKWKNIRSCYTRHLRLKDKAKKPYYLAKHLEFLFPHCKILSSHGNDAEATPSTSSTILWGKMDDIELVDEPQEDVAGFENTVDEFGGEHIYFTVHNAEGAAVNQTNNTEILHVQPIKQEESTQSKVSGFSKWKKKRRLIFPAEKRNLEPVKKKPQVHHVNDTNDDPDLNFLKSLLPDMRRMNNKEKNKLKMKILKEIYTILYPDDAETVLQTI